MVFLKRNKVIGYCIQILVHTNYNFKSMTDEKLQMNINLLCRICRPLELNKAKF